MTEQAVERYRPSNLTSALIALTVAAYALGWVGELLGSVIAGVLSAVVILLIVASGNRC